jgi:hypothetical protein
MYVYLLLRQIKTKEIDKEQQLQDIYGTCDASVHSYHCV